MNPLLVATSTKVPKRHVIGLKHSAAAAAAAKSFQSRLTLCDPTDSSPLGSPIPGILQTRTLEWVAISFSNAWKWKVKVKSLSGVWPSATPWTAAYQAPLSMGFPRQEYWSGVPSPSPPGGWGLLYKKALICLPCSYCFSVNLCPRMWGAAFTSS